jgi:hypothetical protein
VERLLDKLAGASMHVPFEETDPLAARETAALHMLFVRSRVFNVYH